MKDKLMELIGQAIGETSMAWQPIPTGVFDSSKAIKIFEELHSQILSLIKENMPKKNICIKGHKLFDDCGSYDGFRCDCGAVDYNKGLDDCMKAMGI